MPHYIMHNAFTITDEAWIYLVHEIIYYEWFSQAIWSLRWLHMLNYLVWCIISVNYCRSCCEINLCAHCLNDWVSNLPLLSASAGDPALRDPGGTPGTWFLSRTCRHQPPLLWDYDRYHDLLRWRGPQHHPVPVIQRVWPTHLLHPLQRCTQ